MRSTTLVFRRCATVAALPVASAGTAALAGAWWYGSDAARLPDEATTAGLLAPWLHLPAFVAAAVCCCTAAATWPLLARDRPGADWVRRATNRPLSGCGAAMTGALLALALWLLPIAAVTAMVAPPPFSHVHPQARQGLTLVAPVTELTFATAPMQARELRLRPIALFVPGGSLAPTSLTVSLNGAPLPAGPIEFSGTRQLVRVPLQDVTVTDLSLRRAAGELPLLFPPGAIELVASAPCSALLNALLAASTWLLAAAVTLAFVTLLGPLVALPVVITLTLAALLLQSLGQLGPVAAATAQLLRGRWLPADSFFLGCLPSLTTGAVAMIVAMIVRRRWHR